ncbi:hypothetical protein N7474_004948 [Penicillium riverlandense]|uniref:uncharacterized protein n=1 Tax=Penicillium riverlandense TaxID=1903569 RepID=UPI00254887CF|nr:uncharacterized protein N7474_004948 [Penicillium riverlandense]KAJ5819357.1 hypothetical protein N7474_004948 [Penicillium riverlandense]
MVPLTTAQWTVNGSNGVDSLHFEGSVALPPLGEQDCLIEVEAVSLNYRDLAITKGIYVRPVTLPVVPCSDASGIVIATGSKVTRFQRGERVCTLFNQGHLTDPISPQAMRTGLGADLAGGLRQHGLFHQDGLVAAPPHLSAIEASTLSCAPLTAWNALYGLRALQKGQSVLIQGSGGVSLAGLQFARAAGAFVIATTSSNAKAQRLKELGADTTAKKRSPGGQGVNHVIEIGGPTTFGQSVKAVAPEGVISVVGWLGGTSNSTQLTVWDAISGLAILRRIMVGSRAQFEQMNQTIGIHGIRPVVDKTFPFEEAREAYRYFEEQQHFGKVVIQVSGQ